VSKLKEKKPMINQERLLNTFLELVRIDSPSGGEKEAAEYVANRLRALGLKPQMDELNNVFARWDGKGKPIFLNAHTDRVEPGKSIKPIVMDGVIKSDGATILGADDLAGVAAILEALQSILEDRLSHVPLEVAITTQEEIGLHGAKGLDLTQFRAKEGVVLDSHGPVGEIILASPAHNHLDVVIHGKAAHSGAMPEQGIDALRVAANAIRAMKLGRIDKETTANIGVIHGGAARNIVPDRIELLAEARSRNPRKLERQTRAMKKALEQAAKPFGARIEITITRAYNHYKFREGDNAVKRVARAIQKIGRKPRYALSGGGSDANIFNAKRMKAVVASVGYEQIHTTGESLPIGELVKAAELVVALATG
jgi:tripeptide aminopeptidase